MNLKDVMIENIDLNNKLKEVKDSFSNELKVHYEQSKNFKENDYNTIMEENIKKKDNNNISNIKSNLNNLRGHNIFQNRLIQSNKNKHKININMDIKKDSKDKPLRMSSETSNNNPTNLEKEKRKKINNLEIITDKIQLDNNRKINSVENDLIYLGSNRNLINTKKSSSDNTINDNEKKQTKKFSIKSLNKNKNENNNIFTNDILGTKSLYTIRNNKKYYFNINKDKNKKKTIEGKRSKEKDLTSVKYQEIYNEIRPNKHKKKNLNKNNIYINNSQQNNAIKDLAKYSKKKDELSNNKNTIINEKVTVKNESKYLQKNEKELNNKILEKRVKKRNLKRNNTRPLQKKINEKYLNVDISPYNTISVKESSNNNQKKINQMSYKNINKLLINNYYYKIKTYVKSNKINIKRRSENKKNIKEKDNFLTIFLASMPKKIISTPTYKKLSLSTSPRADSKDKKKESISNNITYKKIDI
jgi:hypothetical protein